MKPRLRKRRRWRPLDEVGKPILGGAGGFHLPQRDERVTSLNAPKRKRTKPGPREWAKDHIWRETAARMERMARRGY